MAKQREEPNIYAQLGYYRPRLPDVPAPIDLTRGIEQGVETVVHDALYPVMRGIVRKLPRLKFSVQNWHSVIPYYRGDARGIGLLEVDTLNETWFIHSPRYDKARGNRCVTRTKSAPRAVGEAVWAFRPLSDAYYLATAAKGAEELLGKVARELRSSSKTVEFRDTMDFAGNLSSVFYREAKHLLDMGHMFLDANFTEKLRNSVKLYEMGEVEKGAKEDKHLYLRGMSGGAVLIAMIPKLADVTTNVEFRRVGPEAVPQWAVDAVNVLSILPVGDYVEGVGFRTGESEFIIPMPKEA